MSITSMDDLVAGLNAQKRATYLKLTNAGSGVNLPFSLWKATGNPAAGATPASGAGAVPTKSTDGAIKYTNPGGGALSYLAQLSAAMANAGLVSLYDRLVHTSGLSGTSIAAQTINSVAITRPDANGADTELWIEHYTATGSTLRTASVSYTNQDGTAGRTGTATIAASTPAGRLTPVVLQAGDTGVRSVETLTLSASTGTAGDFGITIMRRIHDFGISSSQTPFTFDAFDLGLPKIDDDACLAMMAMASSSTVAPLSAFMVFAQN